MKTIKLILSAMMILVGASLANVASAACCSVKTGTVVAAAIVPINNNTQQFFFSLTGVESNKTPCNTSDRFSIDGNSPTGKAVMASILTAKSNGNTVQVVGKDSCAGWPDSGDIGSLSVQ